MHYIISAIIQQWCSLPYNMILWYSVCPGFCLCVTGSDDWEKTVFDSNHTAVSQWQREGAYGLDWDLHIITDCVSRTTFPASRQDRMTVPKLKDRCFGAAWIICKHWHTVWSEIESMLKIWDLLSISGFRKHQKCYMMQKKHFRFWTISRPLVPTVLAELVRVFRQPSKHSCF